MEFSRSGAHAIATNTLEHDASLDAVPSLDEIVCESHRFAHRVESMLSGLEFDRRGGAYRIQVARALLASLVEALDELGERGF